MRYFLSNIAEIVGGRLIGCDVEVTAVATDSRSYAINGDTLFVAMRGVNHDAHDHIDEVAERGSKAFMVEREVAMAEGCGAVIVNNSLEALQKLAAHHRMLFSGTVVGITGSNGKTTIKEWIAQSTPHEIRIFRSPRSYNSQLGVALSLLMLDDSYDIALIEAGISQKGEMERLYNMIRPDMVIFTSIGDAHAQGFASLEEKISEKLILARDAKNIIYHSAYTPLAEEIEAKYKECVLIDAASVKAEHHVEKMFDVASQRNLEIVQTFHEQNSAHKYRCDLDKIQPMAMRLEVKQGVDNSIIIDDSYSVDLNSLSIALDHLRSIAGERKTMLVLSDILQSGNDVYTEVARMVREAGINHFVGVGEALERNQELFGQNSTFFASVAEALANITKLNIADYAILIKGNRASRMERLSHRLEQRSHTTVLEVDLQAMTRNINFFRSKIGSSTRLMAMVKASSYGAGETEVAQMLQKQGVDYLAVAFADEGVALREGGITMPIVVLNADDASFDTMIAHSLEPEIYSLESLTSFVRAVERAGEINYPIHLKIDSGMHRLGLMSESEIYGPWFDLLQRKQSVRIASIFTHLCVADDTTQDDFSRQQIATFDRISSAIMAMLPYRPLRHAAASEAMLRFEEARFDMCRLGIGLYGYSVTAGESLEPVSTLRTRIVQIRTLQDGETVGYGRNGKIVGERRIATIPVGYADGLNRRLGNGAWEMIVNGKRAKTIGNICMDSCMIDITDIEGVQAGSEVTIFSSAKGNTAEDMAAVLGTIPYEVLTSVGKRVKRIYINE